MNRFKLAFFYCFGFISIGCVISQIIPLLNKEFSSFEKSLILGLGALISFFMAIVFGKLSDTIKKIKPSIYINLVSYLVFVCLLFLSDSKFIKGISFIFIIVFSRMLMSTIETFIFVQKKESFEKYHCMGALGLIIGSLLSSYLQNHFKLILCLISGILSIFLVFQVNEKKRDHKPIQLKDMILLLKNHQYLRILFLFFFLMFMGFADQFVVVDKMISLGASSTLISMKYALQAFMEIPLYLFIHKILEKFQLLSLLLFCIFMSALKLGLYGIVNSSFMIIIVSLLQIVTHPFLVILSKKMIEQSTSSELMASSQIIGFAFYFSVSGFLASFISQWLNTQFSYNITLYVFSMFSVFPLIIWCFMKKYDKVKEVVKDENIFN